MLGYKQLYSEEGTWLTRGRRKLIDGVLRRELGGKKGQCLDVGAGGGFYISTLAQCGPVDAVELQPEAIEILRHISEIRDLFTTPVPFQLDRRYNFIICMDVLQAIPDEEDAIDWIASHLELGGILLITVPAYQWLFGYHDRAVTNLRRYTAAELEAKIGRRLAVRQVGYFNSALFPLAVAGRVLGTISRTFGLVSNKGKQRATLPGPMDRFFSAILNREACAIVRGACPLFGLTVFCIAERHS